MRKTFTILILLAIGVQLMAQTGFSPAKRKLDRLQKNDVIHNQNAVKSPGDVIWTEDFDGADWSGTSLDGEPVPENAPTGWVLGDLTSVDHYFRWDTVGPRGYYTNPYGPDSCFVPQEPVFTTTQSNGYMMMEGDWYHTGADCGIIYMSEMDGYIEYQTGIDFSDYNVVHLTFEQAARFCCTNISDGRPFFKVSTDNGTTWNSVSLLEADVNNQIGEFGGPAYTSELDVSNYVAGESDVWFRFQLTDLSHYFWIIDDIAFVEPVANDIKFTDYWNDYIHYRDDSESFPLNSTHDFTEGFYQYPWFLVQEYKGFHAVYENFGGQAQTNFVHNVEIWKDGYFVEAFASEAITNLPAVTQDTSMIQATLWPWGIGEYTFVHYPSTDAPDENPSNDTLYRHMKVGNDSMVSVVDFSKVNSYISPDDWESFDEEGDGLGFMINLPHPSLHDQDGNADYYILEGTSLYVASNTRAEEIALFENGEARVVAGMYKYDSITDAYTEQISSAEYTLTINDTNSVVFIPFVQDGTSEYVFEGGTFLVAFNMYGTWNRPEDGNLQGWNVWSADNTVQKNSREACLTVNATITDSSDIAWTTGEGPAFGFKLSYTDWGPNPLPVNATFIVKNTLGDFVEGALVESSQHGSATTNSEGMAILEDFYYWQSETVTISDEGYEDYLQDVNWIGSDTTFNIVMAPVGIQNMEQFNVSVYPNPSNGIFTVDGEGGYHVQIIDMSGKTILRKNVFGQESLNLSDKPQGVYYIRIKNNSEETVKTIIIK